MYAPALPRSSARKSALRHLVDTFFDGSAENAVAALLGGEGSKLSEEQLERIADLVKKSRTGSRMTLLLLNTTIKISLIVIGALVATSLLRRQSAAVRHFVLAAALRAPPPRRSSASSRRRGSRTSPAAGDRPAAGRASTTRHRRPSAAVARRQVHRRHVAAGMRLRAARRLDGAASAWRLPCSGSDSRVSRGSPRTRVLSSTVRGRSRGRHRAAHTDCAGRRWSCTATIRQSSARGASPARRSLLPADALDWPADRIRIVLAHELAHVRARRLDRADGRRSCCARPTGSTRSSGLRRAACASRANRRVTMRCCRWVWKAQPTRPSWSILRARFVCRQPFVPAAAIARPSSLERRVRAMLNLKLNRDPITRSASVAAAIVLAAVTVLVAGFGVSAQGQFGSVSGTVLDQNRPPINGVRLVLSNAVAQTKNEVKSDADGHYRVRRRPGRHLRADVRVDGHGVPETRRPQRRRRQADVTLNAAMKIGSLSETITVTSAPDDRPNVSGLLQVRVRPTSPTRARSRRRADASVPRSRPRTSARSILPDPMAARST